MTRRTTLDTLMALLVFAVLLYVAAQPDTTSSEGQQRPPGLRAGLRGAPLRSMTPAERVVHVPTRVGGLGSGVPPSGTPGTNGMRPASSESRAAAIHPARLPDTATDVAGTATWYCGAGSRCTHGYGPGSMVAAAGSELRRPGWRGSWVRVHANGRHVDVQLVDTCLCRGSRIVDLYAAAFSRLAPTSRGEIFVTVEWLGPRLPPTDTGGTK